MRLLDKLLHRPSALELEVRKAVCGDVMLYGVLLRVVHILEGVSNSATEGTPIRAFLAVSE